MASVQSKRASKYAHQGMVEDEAPEHLESAGELLIKQLVQKQINTTLSLDQLLREEKKFERGVGVVSLDEIGAGTRSLEQFKEKQSEVETVGELEGRGLTKKEALTLVNCTRQSKAAPEAQMVVQEYIDQCLHFSDPSPADFERVRKQEKELALSVKPNSVETRLYQFAMQNGMAKPKTDSRPPDHPVHQLLAMEQSLLRTPDPETLARTLRRKRRQQAEALAPAQVVHYKAPERGASLWDATESPINEEKKPHGNNIYTCKNQSLYTVREGKIVEITNEIKVTAEGPQNSKKSKPSGQSFISLQNPTESPEISGRLSEEEIRELSRFRNYQQGTVSKTLYIKNLPVSIKETELAAIFDQFEDPDMEKIIYRLMSGKMRGQAFIKFPTCEKAAAALEKMNGVILRGKPMIIQYGKQ